MLTPKVNKVESFSLDLISAISSITLSGLISLLAISFKYNLCFQVLKGHQEYYGRIGNKTNCVYHLHTKIVFPNTSASGTILQSVQNNQLQRPLLSAKTKMFNLGSKPMIAENNPLCYQTSQGSGKYAWTSQKNQPASYHQSVADFLLGLIPKQVTCWPLLDFPAHRGGL